VRSNLGAEEDTAQTVYEACRPLCEPGAASQGKTTEEAQTSLKEDVELYIDSFGSKTCGSGGVSARAPTA
jgi:hypothetical protein